MRMAQTLIRVAQLFLLTATLSCSSGGPRLFRESGVLMGTIVEVSVAAQSEEVAKNAIQIAFAEMRRVDELVSCFKAGSVISRLNREGHKSKVLVGKEVFSILRQSASIAASSGGAFDVTVWPVVRLWKFQEVGGMVPNATIVAEENIKVGYHGIIFDESTYSVGFTRDGMGIDLGAIAAGWAADLAMARLQALGVSGAIVDAGGELRILGAKPGGAPWRIGVQHPRRPGELLLSLDLRDAAVATAGDYERFFVQDGVRYHHILDPATGMPARGCQSVTVLAATAAEADACSTAAFVLGPERGLAFLRGRPGVQGVIVDAAGALHWTDVGLERTARR